MTGYIHSVESFGTVDGPGVRLVVFMQGCPLRCRYCHNPDTWQTNTGAEMTADEILQRFDKNKEFYKSGGITVTGGEPLLQIDFLLDLFSRAKERGIHLAIDTSGITYREGESEYNKKLLALLSMTDLVMLDLKHMDRVAHTDLTGRDNDGILAFARLLSELKIPTWIRYVLVPGVTDGADVQSALGEFIASLSSVKAIDVLPYHTLGVEKYKSLGIPYSLDGVPPATAEDVRRAKQNILSAYKKAKTQK